MAVSQEMMKGTVVPIILKLLSEQEMYGYEIIRVVHERTDRALEWKEGTIYPWLHRLEEDGLVRSVWRDAASGRQRKYYGLTQRGNAALRVQVEEWQTLSRAVNVLLSVPLPA